MNTDGHAYKPLQIKHCGSKAVALTFRGSQENQTKAKRMKRVVVFSLLSACILPAISSRAVDLKQSKFTQIVNDVQVISGADKSAKPAAMNDLFKVPDILRTGPNSRAELVAEDQTITRVGANTIFSFDTANRTINLQKGSLLFHSPKGKGGGAIRTGSATASVLGTTIVVTTTPDGGFKVLVLEGQAEVKFLTGLKQHLDAGQMTFILPGGGMSPIIFFRLDANVRGSQLVNGFSGHPLPSSDNIGAEIAKQGKMIQSGKAKDTGLLVGNRANQTQIEAVDSSTLQNYFNQQNAFQPTLSGNGYLTVDGFHVAPENPNDPVADAFFPAQALSVNVDIGSATLNPNHTFVATGPFNVTVPGMPDQSDFLENPFSGFFGRNINIRTPRIDMTPYSQVPRFDILAAQNITISDSLNFDGLVRSFYLTAGGRIAIASGSTISANAFFLNLFSFSPMRFNNVNIDNTAGSVTLKSWTDLALDGGSMRAGSDVDLFGHTGVRLNGTRINAVGGAYIVSDFAGTGANPAISLNNATISVGDGALMAGNGDVNLNNTSINSSGTRAYMPLSSVAGSLSLNGGSIGFSSEPSPALLKSVQLSAGVDVNIAGTGVIGDSVSAVAGRLITINSGASIVASTITLNAGDGIVMDNVTMSGRTLNARAVNDVNVKNTDLSSVTDVNISGHTLAFESVNFAGSPKLKSDVGQLAANPNTGAAVQRGYVNFVNGVTYSGTLITSANQSTYVNPSSGPGIFISPR